MELLSYSPSTCCHAVNLNGKLVVKSSNSQPKVSNLRKPRLLCAKFDSGNESLGFYKLDRPFLTNPNQESFKIANSKVLSGGYDGYVIGGEEEARKISGAGESAARVLIPGLPEEFDGESAAEINSCFWEWKPKFSVHYEKAGCENVMSPPVLFLPGFGVGSFHYEKQLKDLGREYRVWAMDFLGQGMSLPSEDPAPLAKRGDASERKDILWGFGDETEPWASELVYSIDLWRDQVQYFIEEVIGEPVYLIGNSLGGYVALYFAACNPHLVKGVTLLNATPFWGFLPNPMRSPRLAKLFPWAGTFPLPARVRKLTELLWQKISDPSSIAEILKQVYADHSMKVDKVFSRILETTEHPAAAASLASIMFAPQGQLSFGEALSRCQTNDVPICLMYGKEDPWVRPVWGLQVKRQVPEAPYYEISPAGHCPHDEVPEDQTYINAEFLQKKTMNTKLSSIFPSVKIKTPKPSSSSSRPTKISEPRNPISESKPSSAWSVYLIISTNTPIKTYVGVTTSFCRRLKQHNGELKGGAKATRSGRPWICACLIEGFKDQSEASEFESKWKTFSRKLPRKREKEDSAKQANDSSLPLLQHREKALSRVEGSLDCSHLQIDWHLNPF